MREFIIDWFQCTIFPKDDLKKELKFDLYNSMYDDFNHVYISYLFRRLFNISPDLLIKSKGYNGYNISYSYRNIKIMCCDYREDMGFNIFLSGKACRDFEELNIKWQDLCTEIFLISDKFNFNRIDIAIDSINLKDYTIEQLYSLIKEGCCSTKFRKVLNIDSMIIDTLTSTGRTLQFGSKSSDIEITFYDKLNERENAGYELSEDIESWFRCELRFRHDNALDIFDKILDDSFCSDYVLGILYNYIDFKDFSLDSNKSRRLTAQFWLDFVNSSKKVRLSSRSSETSICKKKLWLCNSVSKTELLVYLADLKTINNLEVDISFILTFISIGVDNLKKEDIKMINDYRIENNLSPYTLEEIKDYVSNIIEIFNSKK